MLAQLHQRQIDRLRQSLTANHVDADRSGNADLDLRRLIEEVLRLASEDEEADAHRD